MEILKELSKRELWELLVAYDEYIQDANDRNLYRNDWYPVCISEFYMNDFEHWKVRHG